MCAFTDILINNSRKARVGAPRRRHPYIHTYTVDLKLLTYGALSQLTMTRCNKIRFIFNTPVVPLSTEMRWRRQPVHMQRKMGFISSHPVFSRFVSVHARRQRTELRGQRRVRQERPRHHQIGGQQLRRCGLLAGVLQVVVRTGARRARTRGFGFGEIEGSVGVGGRRRWRRRALRGRGAFLDVRRRRRHVSEM